MCEGGFIIRPKTEPYVTCIMGSVSNGWVGPNFEEELPYPIEYIELPCPGLGKYTLDLVRPGPPAKTTKNRIY